MIVESMVQGEVLVVDRDDADAEHTGDCSTFADNGWLVVRVVQG